MIYLVVGGVVAIALFLLVRWFVAADVRQVAKVLRWTGVVLAAVFALFLILTGRWALLIPIAGAVALAFSRLHAGRSRGGLFSRGKTSSVETRFLRLSLDHDSGAMTGIVREGPHAGDIGRLSLQDLLDLLDRCRGEDPRSVQLLEAYLDREHPDWRDKSAADSGERPPPGRTGMTREEAFRILGIDSDASEEQIRDAHRRLMGKLHPDRGGSDYLAAQINQAKDLLLGG
ncbi:MAG: DnaJ domain-containing protein [Alphaproteobacteria bacterium]